MDSSKFKIVLIVVFVILITGVGALFYFQQETPSTEPQDEGLMLYSSFINIHLEPEASDEMEYHWANLEELMRLADQYEMLLVLHFSESWATYALENEDRLNEVRSWESDGHEIGLHHHGTSHANWDGYSNEISAKKEDDYKGTIVDLMEIMNQLPVSGQILSASMTNEDTDWPEGVIYRTSNEGGELGPTPAEMVGFPKSETWNGYDVTWLGKMGYNMARLQIQITLEMIEEFIFKAEEGEVMGLVLNDDSMEEDMAKIEELFSSFQEWEVPVQTVTDILDDYPY